MSWLSRTGRCSRSGGARKTSWALRAALLATDLYELPIREAEFRWPNAPDLSGTCAESTYAAIEPMLFAATRRPATGLSRANPDQAEDEAAADFSR